MELTQYLLRQIGLCKSENKTSEKILNELINSLNASEIIGKRYVKERGEQYEIAIKRGE